MPPPPSWRATLAAAAALLLAPSTGRAQLVMSAHAVGDVSVGWTDNALSQPSTTQTAAVGGASTQTTPGGTSEVVFLSFRPGVLILAEGVKTMQRLSYTFTSTHFLGRSDANSTGHQLDYNLLYTLSSRSELMTGAGMSYGNQNIFNLMRPAGSPPPTGQPAGSLTFLTASVYENYSYDFSNDWRVFQGAAIGTYSVLDIEPDQPHRITLDNRVGTERRFGRDALIAEASTGVLFNTATEANGLRTAAQSQLLAGGIGRWRRDLNENFATEVSAGAVVAFNPSDASSLLGPTIGAALRFHDDFGEAAAGYNRSFQPNVFLGQIFYGDDVFVRGSVPVFERTTNLRLSTGASLLWSNLVDSRLGRLSSTLRVFSTDVALTWDSHAGVNASLRYQYFNQKGNPDDERPLFDFSRNAVLFTVGGMFPYRYAPPVPREPSGRVDRSDRPSTSNDGPPGDPRRSSPPKVLAPAPGTNTTPTPTTGVMGPPLLERGPAPFARASA